MQHRPLSIRHTARKAPNALRLAILGASLYMAAPAFTDSAQAVAANSSAQQHDFAIGAGPLGTVLNRFATEAGVVLSFDTALTQGKQSQGITGRYSIEQGFAVVLAGAGLQAVAGSNNTWVLVEAVQGGALQLGATTISSSTASVDYHSSYASPKVTIGKMEQAQKDIPQSVTVVTRQRMNDQNLDTFDQVIMQTPGVSRQFVNSGQSNYVARGFSLTKTMTDGVYKAFSFANLIAQSPDMSTLERVEVIRGAPGLLLGAGDPSGVVNFVRKRPKEDAEVSVLARAGSWDYYRTELDLTGSLNENGSLRGRTVLAYEDRDYFYDRAHTEMPLFYGVLEADLTDDTVWMAGYRHQNYDLSGVYTYQGLPVATDGSDLKLSRSTSVGPDWSAYKTVANEFFTDITHHFNDDWSAKLGADYQRSEVYELSVRRPSTGISPTTGIANVTSMIDANYDVYQGGVDLSLNGAFSWRGIEQKLVVGTNFQKEERVYKATIGGLSVTTVNLLTDPEMSAITKPDSGVWSTNELHNETYGVYSNFVMSPIDPLKIILGGRLTWYKTENYANGSQTSQYRQDSELTPYFGLVYSLTPDWSAYASYTDIFQVQSNLLTSSGAPLDPSVGKNYEIGLKGELFDKRLNVSLALFRMIQDNRSAIDPNYPTGGCLSAAGGYCYVNAGKVKSEGFELEVNGEVLPGWQVFAGYTYNEATYLKDPDAYGNASANENAQFGDVTPKQIARAFTTYELPGVLSRFSIGAGISAQSDLNGTNYIGRSSHMPGRAVWDAMASYKVDENWTVSANVNNVLDKVYYNDEYGYRYGEPRSVMFTVRGNFKDF